MMECAKGTGGFCRMRAIGRIFLLLLLAGAGKRGLLYSRAHLQATCEVTGGSDQREQLIAFFFPV